MAHTVLVELPDPVFDALSDDAREKETTVEALVRNTVASLYDPDHCEWGDATERERRYHHDLALSREDLWGSPGDRVYDEWTPSNQAMS